MRVGSRRGNVFGTYYICRGIRLGPQKTKATPAEKNCTPIEPETLSAPFGCERFHEYLSGRYFIVQNDHQPLQSKSRCRPRVQRFCLRLQRSDFTLEYSPGKTLVVADTLSQADLPDTGRC